MKSFLSLFFLYFLVWGALQAEELAGEQTRMQQAETSLEKVALKLTKTWQDVESPENSESLISFRPNYLLFWSESSVSEPMRQAQEAQFQLSLKKELYEVYGWRLVGAYTQNSFWQLYNIEDSRPFRETNYAPQIFFQTAAFGGSRFPVEFELGYMHQSNGGREPLSRSWDRYFAGLYHKSGAFSWNHRFWTRISEAPKNYAEDPRGDENPDIEDYYGNQEGQYHWDFEKMRLYAKERYNFSQNKGMLELQLSGVLPKSKLRWMIYHFEGYGESLIDYNRFVSKWGLGVIVAPGFR